jgi:hypothetical protein
MTPPIDQIDTRLPSQRIIQALDELVSYAALPNVVDHFATSRRSVGQFVLSERGQFMV